MGDIGRGASGDLSGRRERIVEILVSWGASAQPEVGEVLESVAEFRSRLAIELGDAPALLRALHARASFALSAPLAEEVRQSVEAMGSTNPGPSSLRSRIDGLLARASAELSAHLTRQREELGAEIASWAPLFDPAGFNTALAALWQTEGAEDVGRQVADVLRIGDLRKSLEASRRAVVAGLEKALSTSAHSATPDEIGQVKEALRSESPQAILRAGRRLTALREGERRRALVDEVADLGTGLAALCAEARSALARSAKGPNRDSAQLLLHAVSRAEEAIETSAGAGAPEGLSACRSALVSWSAALRTCLECGPGATDHALESRSAVVRAFVDDLAQWTNSASPQAREMEMTLRSAADAGVRPFQEAVQAAVDLIRETRERVRRDVQEATAKLRASADQLTKILQEGAPRLPTAQVVEARLRLDQVDVVAAALDTGEIEALGRSIQKDVDRLQGLAALALRRQGDRVQAESDSIQNEAKRLAAAATPRIAARLDALASKAQRANPRQFPALRLDLEKIQLSLSQSVRWSAGRTLRAAAMHLKARGGSGDPKPGKEKLHHLAESVRSAMAADDLSALQREAVALRAELRKSHPLARPTVRIALGLLLAAGLSAAWVASVRVREKPAAYRLLFDESPDPQRVVLYRDGRRWSGAGRAVAGGIVFELPPGRYEVFVDDRFTGRVIRAPAGGFEVRVPLPKAG